MRLGKPVSQVTAAHPVSNPSGEYRRQSALRYNDLCRAGDGDNLVLEIPEHSILEPDEALVTRNQVLQLMHGASHS